MFMKRKRKEEQKGEESRKRQKMSQDQMAELINVLWCACLLARLGKGELLTALIPKLKDMSADQAAELLKSSPLADNYPSKGINVLWYACSLARKEKGELLTVLIPKLEDMSVDHVAELLRSSPLAGVHGSKGVNVLWYACLLARDEKGALLAALILKLKDMSADQVAELLRSSPLADVHDSKGINVLWYACSLADENQPNLLSALILKLQNMSANQVAELLKSSPLADNDPAKGINVLWYACSLARKEKGELLTALIPKLEDISADQVAELLRSSPLADNYPSKGINVLWYACLLADVNQPNLLNALILKLQNMSADQVAELLKSLADSIYSKGINVLWYACLLARDGKGELLTALIPKLKDMSSDQVVELLNSIPQIGTDPRVNEFRSLNTLNFISTLIDRKPEYKQKLELDFVMLIMNLPLEILQKLDIGSAPIIYINSLKNDPNNPSETGQSVIRVISSLIDPPNGYITSLLLDFYFKLSSLLQDDLKQAVSEQTRESLTNCEPFFRLILDNNQISGTYIENINNAIEVFQNGTGISPQFKDGCYFWIGNKISKFTRKKRETPLQSEEIAKLFLLYRQCFENISPSSIDLYKKAHQALSDEYYFELCQCTDNIQTLQENLPKSINFTLVCYLDAKCCNKNETYRSEMQRRFFQIIESYIQWDQQGSFTFIPFQCVPDDWWVDDWIKNSVNFINLIFSQEPNSSQSDVRSALKSTNDSSTISITDIIKLFNSILDLQQKNSALNQKLKHNDKSIHELKDENEKLRSENANLKSILGKRKYSDRDDGKNDDNNNTSNNDTSNGDTYPTFF
jgi:regulator of replication initiation timing